MFCCSHGQLLEQATQNRQALRAYLGAIDLAAEQGAAQKRDAAAVSGQQSPYWRSLGELYGKTLNFKEARPESPLVLLSKPPVDHNR